MVARYDNYSETSQNWLIFRQCVCLRLRVGQMSRMGSVAAIDGVHT